MRIRINGEDRDVRERITLDELLTELGVPRAGMAAEVNREVVPKRMHDGTVLNEGDTVEVIRMVGGG